MKYIFKYKIVLVFCAIFYASCTDLDVEPQNSTTANVFLNDIDAYRSFAAKIYAGLALTGQNGPTGNGDLKSIDEGFSEYFRQYWQLQQIPTDETIIAWGDDGLPQLITQSWGAQNRFIRTAFARIYFQVSQANEFIRESSADALATKSFTADEVSEINQMRGEVRFLRALSYSHAIDLYGDVPFYTETSTLNELPTQSSRKDVFNFIVSELNEVKSSLPEAKTNVYGRVDKASVNALLARLYLNAEVYAGEAKYTECISACNEIINTAAYSLTEEYDNLFLADNHTSSEIIFAIPYDGESTQSFGGMTYLINSSYSGSFPDKETVLGTGGGWNGNRSTPNLVDQFPLNDNRGMFYDVDKTKENIEIGNFDNGYTVMKYKNVTSEGELGKNNLHPDTDFPYFRLADVYLMYAESVMQGGTGGDMATAVGYINELRERAYGDASGNITASDITEDFILAERSRELYWEGVRRTDLIRFGQFSNQGTWSWKGGVLEGATTDAFRDLYPIPAIELSTNPNLTQNTGY